MAKGKTLFISDFDDTLAQTDAKVVVKHASGETVEMDPAVYATYEPLPGDEFDFSEFEQLKNPRPIQRFVRLLKKAINHKDVDKVSILTARGHTKPVAKFLKMHGIKSGVAIAAIGSSDPQKKAEYVKNHIENGFNRVAFIDDSPKNVNAVKSLRHEYPGVKILVHQAKEEPEQTSSPKTSAQHPTEKIKDLLRNKITNPKTRQQILLQTALRDKTHPAHQQAVKIVQTYANKHGINIKQK